MARKKKGRDISGWLIVDKPAGMSSAAVVNKVKWAFNARKAGHAGTLDPEATGVLAIALGEATKTVPYITDALKAYSFTVRWGQATNTDDAEGEVIAEHPHRPSEEDIKAALGRFVGDIEQIPPQFSAVKIDGERAYKRARAGEALALEARALYVDSLLLTDRPDADHAVFELVCGKGGYVRAIARDLGAELGSLGHVVCLRRLWSGPFALADSVTLPTIENLARTPKIDRHLLAVECALKDLAEVETTAEGAGRLQHGNPAPVVWTGAADGVQEGDTCWASYQGRALAIGHYRGGALHPSRVLLPT